MSQSILLHRLVLLLAITAAVACSSSPSTNSEDDPDDKKGKSDTPKNGGLNLGGAGAPSVETPPAQEAECGNGELEIGELCDDGNTDGSDGCSADCSQQDPTFDCSTPGKPCVDLVVCGNGVLEGDEDCDDGGTSDDDGCDASCRLEDGFVCPRPGAACLPQAVCGNGQRERGEGCDDGEMPPASGDGCDAQCQVEDGFFCGAAGQGCVQLLCGDGNRTPDEACDDDNLEGGDGCDENCHQELGFRCSTSGCSSICGDGRIVGDEECDDGNRLSGDGCSAACVQEPFFSCAGTPSMCETTIACGNNAVEPGEICDPPGSDGCLAGCMSFSPEVSGGGECGNGVIEFGEECDAPNPGLGCGAGCLTEPGWSCPRPNECFRLPTCGDGIVHFDRGEECDDGSDTNPLDGCHQCVVADGFDCSGLGPSVCVKEVCGDGTRSASESCDDGNDVTGDGCSACVVDTGWVCPVEGADCVERCGDGTLVGDEQCDDGNRNSGDGCSGGCRTEPGFTCPDLGQACLAAVCGDGTQDPSEGCDDGNRIAGDGCGPTCQLEPTITPGPDPIVDVFCGDGLITGDEECDDGNTEPGDGCDAACTVEDYYECVDTLDLPEQVEMVVTYRDFKVASAPGGNPDFEFQYGNQQDNIAGRACTVANRATCGRLDTEGKPVADVAVVGDDELDDTHGPTRIKSPASFAIWFRDNDGMSDQNVNGYSGYNGVVEVKTVERTLTLDRQGQTDSYVFDDSTFLPLTGDPDAFGPTLQDGASVDAGCKADEVRSYKQGCTDLGNASNERNFSFSTELRYFFQYQGGETLEFTGDDDVWVFVNGKLAVDLGGMHSPESGRVVLGDDGRWNGTDQSGEDSNCSSHGDGLPDLNGCLTAGETQDDEDTRFGLVKGDVYEIVLFHAERHTTGSNFRLTLDGFLAPRSFCSPVCGDGVVTGGEVCDDGANTNSDDGNPANDVSGACNDTCSALAYCGDGLEQQGEECDDGVNDDLYLQGDLTNACAPGCVKPPTCGDATVQAAFENCDNGAANSDLAYGFDSCNASCGLGLYCGDGQLNGDEACDEGAENGTTYGPDSCGYDCQPGPRCGDLVRNGPEECDGGANCRADCTLAPFCGDGVVSDGEQCDYGQFASGGYGGCTDACEWGPSCGDGVVDGVFEECDLGVMGNTGEYDGCTAQCTRGPSCGDGVIQAGEQCDNGFNDDVYAFSDDACAPGCTYVPMCGDGILQSAYEACDDGTDNADDAYEGCTTTCDFGPFCGDGQVDGDETCDDGADNTLYRADGSGCGYDCKPAPYCGDGVRNGAEQCDAGTDGNTGEYGGCKSNCTRAPFCGDGKVQGNEQCDAGPTGSLSCTAACLSRDDIR